MKVNKVYKFGVIPKSSLKEIEDIFKIQNRYYNHMVEVKRGKQLYFESLSNIGLDDLIAKKEEAFSKMKEIENKVNNEKVTLRSKIISNELKLEFDKAKKEFETAKTAYFKAKSANSKNISKSEEDRVFSLEKEMIKSLRGYYSDAHNSYWGTYNLTEAAVEDSEKSLYKSKNGRKGLMKFKSFDGTGRLGIQIMKRPGRNIDRSLSSIFSETSDFKNLISMKRKECLPFQKGIKNHGKRSQQRAELKFCIGTKQDNRTLKNGKIKKSVPKPIFAEFDVILHRDFPPGAILKEAVINKKRFGSKIEWSLDLVIEYDEVKPQIKNGKAISYDLGWRHIDSDNYRIAAFKDSNNNEGLITLNVGTLNKADHLKSILDNQFNLMKSLLSDYMKHNNVPDWLEKHKYVLNYKSYSKLLKLFNFWKNNRFDGDQDIFDYFHFWKRKNIHLSNWEDGARRSFLRQRKQMYSTIAKNNSENYEYVFFENLKLDNMAKGKVGGGSRQKSAPSEFRDVFEFRFNKENIIKVEAKNTSKTCNNCNSTEELDSSITEHICSKCNIHFDRDINAAKNILKKGFDLLLKNNLNYIAIPNENSGLLI